MSSYSDYINMLSPAEQQAAPKELFFEGNFELLLKSPKVSVVGSRNISLEGEKRTALVTRELVKRGITVVSGLALGVDTIAHTEALAGKTIAVLGTPLDTVTPVGNTGLLNEIKKHHLAISQFPIGAKVYPGNFPARNKTMALISDATIIIEASEKSGTQHQAWEAIRLGRQIFILENVLQANVSWAIKALEYGAIVLNKENFGHIFDSIADLFVEQA
jgi:DNA processing protein